MKRIIFSIFLLATVVNGFAQQSIKDSTITMGLLNVSYRGLFPGGDLYERFGFNSQMGIDMTVKFKNNFYLTAGGHVLFSDVVKDTSIMSNILTNGLLITDNGLLSSVRTIQSGFVIPLSVGKVFPLPVGPNKNSGVFVEVGGQFIQHRVGIRALDEVVTPVSEEYRKGYDRLANGIGIRESIGYLFLANHSGLNFSVALDFSQNFTQGRRSIQFDTGLPGLEKRRDFLTGIRVSWIFPLYNRAPDKIYYN